MNLDRLFAPESICIIGASEDTHKIGHITLRNIIDSGYTGDIYPVNKKSKSILNLECYKTVSDIPKVPDLAIISIPASGVVEAVTELGKFGVKNVVVFSAGFKEIGSEGHLLEDELVKVAASFEINILGPNCLGFLNTNVNLNATFSSYTKKRGNLRFISQSGAIASSIFDWIKVNGIGIDEFITLGNKAVVSETDILEYFASKKRLKGQSQHNPLAMYLESIVDGKNFLKLVSKFTSADPVLVLKPGKSAQAKKAMLSHTGSLAGEYIVMKQALTQAGVIMCNGLEDLFDLSMAFSWENAPKGPNVAIISNAGGPGVLSSDLVSENGLSLASIPEDICDLLYQVFPRAVSLLNPIDLLGDALSDRYKKALEAVLPLSTVDSVVVLLTPQVMTQIEETAKVIGEVSKKYEKPVLCSFIGGEAFLRGYEVLCKYNVASYEFPERAIGTLGTMWRWQQWVNRPVSGLIQGTDLSKKHVIESPEVLSGKIRAEKKLGYKSLSYDLSKEIAEAFSLVLPKSHIVHKVEDALSYSSNMVFPLVLKVQAPDLLHKTEVSGVETNILNVDMLKTAFTKLSIVASEIEGAVLLLQEQIQGVETICGIRSDAVFGTTLLFGAGGILAELIVDTNIIVGDVTKDVVIDLVSRSKVNKVLSGYRNSKKYNLEKVYSSLMTLSMIKETFPEITDIEVNPLIVTPDIAFVVDLKVLL